MKELPGKFPFTRGVYPSMYRGRHWTMRQYAGMGDAKKTNERFRYLLDHGQTGLSVAFDLPTQMGYDSDHAMSKGEVGRVGVAIDTIEDMRSLFDKIPLDKVSTSMTINSTAMILLSLYIAVAEEKGIDPSVLRGTVQNDILKEYISRGTYIYPAKPSLRLITDLFRYCQKELPKWNMISVSGYHMREAGCTAVQEVAFTILNGISYLEAAIEAGSDVDAIASQISFFFCVHNDFLEEISKFRAARRIWAKIVKEKFHAKEEKSLMLRFHSQTAGCSLTAQQPKNNMVRVTMQALAAVLGGTQSLHTNSYDEALGLPTEESVMTALRTQQILAHESGVANTVDPVAGSYAVESMTDAIEKDVYQYLDKVSKMGGMVSAIESGFVQGEIQKAAFDYQKAIESEDQVLVGVNQFKVDDEESPKIQKIDPSLEKDKRASLEKFKSGRDNKFVEQSLESLAKGARGRENLMPLVLGAVKGKATLGEVSDTLREVFGEYKENVLV